jgi:2-isopropylmalate synthase
LTYEIMTPQSVGVPDSRLVLGKHSGRHALGLRYEQLGFSFERTRLDQIYRRFIALADRIKTVEDADLMGLLADDAAMPAIPPALTSRGSVRGRGEASAKS